MECYAHDIIAAMIGADVAQMSELYVPGSAKIT